MQSKSKQSNAPQCKAMQCKAVQSNAKAKQNKAKKSKPMQSNAKHHHHEHLHHHPHTQTHILPKLFSVVCFLCEPMTWIILENAVLHGMEKHTHSRNMLNAGFQSAHDRRQTNSAEQPASGEGVSGSLNLTERRVAWDGETYTFEEHAQYYGFQSALTFWQQKQC